MRSPAGLQAEGRKLWRSITAEFDLENEPRKVQILAQACRVVDVIAEQYAAAAEAPLTVKGSMGQPVISPDSPEALAALMPDELRSRDGLDSFDAYKSRMTQVVDWLNTQIPGQGKDLAPSVVAAAGVGLTVIDFLKYRLTGELWN